jgi:hypothetical protein
VTHEELEEAIPLYSAGALDRSERQALESHLLTGCATCHATLKEYQAVAGLLPYSLTPVTVPATLRQRIITAAFESGPWVTETVAPSASGTVNRIWAWLDRILGPSHVQPALASLFALLIVGIAAYALWVHSQAVGEREQRRQVEATLQQALARTTTLQQQVAEQEQQLIALREDLTKRAGDVGDIHNTLIEREVVLDQVRAQLAQSEKETAGLRRILAQRDEMLTFLKSAYVQVVSLSGLEAAKSAGAFLLYDQQTRKAFFYAFNMPPLPEGKTYQLWAIVDKPMNAGVFHTDEGNKGRLLMKDLPVLSQIKKFAVSLEPEGGRPQPTGQLYLAGQAI